MKYTIVYQEQRGKQEIVIRYPVLSDAKELMLFINKISKEKSFILFQGEQQTVKQEKAFLADKIRNIQEGREISFMLTVNGEIAGIADVTQKSLAESPQGHFGITLAKKYRGKGLGSLLMETVCTFAEQELNIQVIVLSVFANNEAGLNMYKKQGFVESGMIPKAILHRKKYIDLILMHRLVKK